MGKWRTLFESNLPPVGQREDGEEYEFGPPATTDEIAAAERALGIPLPAEVREMLSEFNGVWYTTTGGRELGHLPDIVYLDTTNLSIDVPKHLADYEPSPPRYYLRRVVFVAAENGFADLWGVCASDVSGHKAGTVVRLDHEVGRLEACHPSLAAFVRGGPFSVSADFIARLAEQGRPPSDLPGLQRRRSQSSFAHWEGSIPADLVAECEDAVVLLIDRLIALGPNPTEQQVRAEIESGLSQFGNLQWIRGEPWIDTREQKDICDALHELIDLSGFEADEEWTDLRDW